MQIKKGNNSAPTAAEIEQAKNEVIELKITEEYRAPHIVLRDETVKIEKQWIAVFTYDKITVCYKQTERWRSDPEPSVMVDKKGKIDIHNFLYEPVMGKTTDDCGIDLNCHGIVKYRSYCTKSTWEEESTVRDFTYVFKRGKSTHDDTSLIKYEWSCDKDEIFQRLLLLDKVKSYVFNYRCIDLEEWMTKELYSEVTLNAVSNLLHLMGDNYILELSHFRHIRQVALQSVDFLSDYYKSKNQYYFLREKIKKGAVDLELLASDKYQDFTAIMRKRYSFEEHEPDAAIWLLFEKCVFKIYHDKWLEYCVCGDIGQRSLDDYIRDCCENDMLAVENTEAVTTFIYYYCYLQSDLINSLDTEHVSSIIELVNKHSKDKSLNAMENLLFSKASPNSSQLYYSINDIDLMDGAEFEKLIAKLFCKMGYEATVTKASGDQGIDVIAIKNGFKYGIQAKCYSSQVGNSAIQEATAGKAYYSLNKVIFVTNNYFSKAAIKLADANGVILWDRKILTEKLMYLNQ